MIRVAVAGAAGRMGETVCEAVEGAEDMQLVGRADPLPAGHKRKVNFASGRIRLAANN